MMRKKVMRAFLALTICLSLAVPVKATEVDDAKKKADTLQNQKNSAEKEKNSLVAQLEKKVKEMEEVQQQISDKETKLK